MITAHRDRRVEHRAVVIAGVGPTGMTAALSLGRYGVDTLVLDRWEDVFPQPRAVHLDDEIYRILGDLGLADEFAAISHACRGLRLVDRNVETITTFDRDPGDTPHGFPKANMFDQPELEALMREAMKRCDSVEFRSGYEIVDIANMGDHVRVDYLDTASDERITVTADYVLGCDGANSVVRSSIGSKMREMGFEQRWLVVDISTPTDLQQWNGVHQLCDSQRAGTYMRIGANRYRWEFQLLYRESAADFQDIESLRPLIAPWLGHAPDADLELIRVTEYTFHARLADRWRDRRVFLLGDAAHQTPPFIGQGLGAGLRDARNLVWKLVAVMNGLLPDNALDTYQHEREPHAAAMIRNAVTVGWAMTGGGEKTAALRRKVFPILARMPGVNGMIVDSATPALKPSGFVRRSALAPRELAGSLFPNVIVDGGTRVDDVRVEGSRRFDAIAPHRFAFVTTVVPTESQRREIVRRGAVVVETPTASDMGRWLAGGRTAAAIVRPDRTVMATGKSLATLHTLVPLSVVPNVPERPTRGGSNEPHAAAPRAGSSLTSTVSATTRTPQATASTTTAQRRGGGRAAAGTPAPN